MFKNKMLKLHGMKSFSKALKSENGYSLASIVAGIPLGVLVFTIVAIAMSNFVTTYQETRLFNQLQEDLFLAVETMKYGYAVDNITKNYGLIGIMTAHKARISNTRNRISLEPIIVNPGQPFNSTFYRDDSGVIRCSGTYAFQSFSGSEHPIFPEASRKIGHRNQFYVDDLIFSPVKSLNGVVHLVKIYVKATVRFREKGNGQSLVEDLKMNTRTIEYETLVHIANATTT